MSAGRDVERLIATWLTEESPGRAPDRVLSGAAHTIDQTKQRRHGVDWREPVTLSLRTIAAVAAVIVLVVAGAAWVGRSTAVAAPGNSLTPQTTPAPLASGATLDSFRAARNTICAPATERLLPLNRQLDLPGATVADRAAVLDQIVALLNQTVDSLAILEAPPDIAADQAADVTRHRDSILLISHARDLLRENKLTEAAAVDQATGIFSDLEERFEQKYALQGCP